MRLSHRDIIDLNGPQWPLAIANMDIHETCLSLLPGLSFILLVPVFVSCDPTRLPVIVILTWLKYAAFQLLFRRKTIMVQVSKALAGTSAALSLRALFKLEAQVQAMVRCLDCPGGPWYEEQPPRIDRNRTL